MRGARTACPQRVKIPAVEEDARTATRCQPKPTTVLQHHKQHTHTADVLNFLALHVHDGQHPVALRHTDRPAPHSTLDDRHSCTRLQHMHY